MTQILSGNDIKQIRGKGLFLGAEFHSDKFAYNFATKLIQNGLIAKPTQKNIIRFSPPLIINDNQLNEALLII